MDMKKKPRRNTEFYTEFRGVFDW